jgi:flagellar hook-associated protein 3 FlgL
MRVTQLMMTNGAIAHMADSKEMIHKLQERVSGGKAFSNSSEDPTNASLALGLRSSLVNIQNYQDTNQLATDWMNASEFGLQQMEDVATKAQNLVLRGLNDSLSDTERSTALAPDMGQLLQQALDFANTQQNGQYLFSGVYTTTKPFSLDTVNLTASGSPTVVYNPRNLALPTAPPPGVNSTMQRTIAPNQSVTINVMGESVMKDFLQSIADAQHALATVPFNRAALETSMYGRPTGSTAAITPPYGLQYGLNTLDAARTSNGARLRQVQSVGDYLDKSQIEARSLLSQKEDANLAEAIMMLKGQEATYQAVLQVSQRASSATSLFDLMR